jgi:arylsulfatase A-like enzyme
MTQRRAIALLSVCCLACLLAGCGGEEPPRVLADFRFDQRLVADDDPAPLWESGRDQLLGTGWDGPEAEGRWLRGPVGKVRLALLGHGLRLRYAASTHPALAALGQRVELRLNGRAFARLDMPGSWGLVDTVLALPDSLVRRGGNVLAIVPARAFVDGELAGKALYMRRLTVTAELTDVARDRLLLADGLEPLDTEYALREVGRIPRPDPPATRPDVLMIVLDAARADHLGCYGYGRDTTPFIDGLAAEGVRFEQVVAPAPYTLCSVPTILTGRSWREHGLVREGGRLPGDLPTLAGMLGDAGYHTAAYSENPWVSAETGMDRGFAVFEPTWTLSPEAGTAPVDRAVAALDDHPADRPLFCYVHLIPPHHPYAPPPAHDRFGDGSYTGPADGSIAYMADVDKGRRAWTPADRDRLVDLYDGHLHWADTAVRRLMEAWWDSDRARPLLTVVLSDHGEAFGEHGRFLHNSTLYEEMLRVPLVFHPRELAPALPDPGRLRSLEDVAPMILRCLGLPLDRGRTWPRHFLDAYSGQDQSRRHILVRSGDDAEFGLRTQHFLASYRTVDDQELFNLELDPGQTVNRRRGEPLLYFELINTARRLRAQAAPQTPGGPAAPLDADAAAALKALGY